MEFQHILDYIIFWLLVLVVLYFQDIDRLIEDLREYKIEGSEYEHLKTLRSILPDEDEV